MTDGESLYRAVLIAPHDDAPRLVYADWLEERGELERAELIRHMVHFPRDRAGYRPPKPGSLYWPDAPAWIEYGVRRGFVAELAVATPQFLAHAGDLFGRHPVTVVYLMDRHPSSRADGVAATVTTAGPERSDNWPPILFPDVSQPTELVFPSAGRAMKALSDAAVAFGRNAAGLPPLNSGMDR
jgi:uncharacterized protein (TIGR02996 family)